MMTNYQNHTTIYLMTQFLYNIIHSGLNHAPDSETIKRVILVNKISIVFFFASITFSIGILAAKLYTLSYFVPLFMLSFISVLIFNRQGKFLSAKFILFSTIAFGTYVYSGILGPSSGIQYTFLSLIAFSFGLFGTNEQKLKFMSCFLCLLCFFLLKITGFSFFYKVNLTPSQLLPVYTTSLINIFIIIWLTMAFFEQFSIHYKHHLKQVLSTYKLSEREGEVMVRVLNGESNKTISDELFIEEGTVKNHLTSIYRKVNVSNRNELMAKLSQ